MADKEIIKLTKAETWLIQAQTVEDALELRPMIEAAAQAYKKKYATETDEYLKAQEIKIFSERRLGQLLLDMEKQGPGEYQRSHLGTVAPAYDDLGITKQEVYRWQTMARVSDEEYEDYKARCWERRTPMTQAGVIRLANPVEPHEPNLPGLEDTTYSDLVNLIAYTVQAVEALLGKRSTKLLAKRLPDILLSVIDGEPGLSGNWVGQSPDFGSEYPEENLAHAVIFQGFKDLDDANPAIRLEAFCYLLYGGDDTIELDTAEILKKRGRERRDLDARHLKNEERRASNMMKAYRNS